MSAPGGQPPGGQRPPPYGRFQPPRQSGRQPTAPYASDFMFNQYGNLEPHHQEAAFVADHGRAAFEAYMSHGTLPAAVFRTGSYMSFDNTSFRTIDVTTHVNDHAALLGNRRDRDQYWQRQLQFNLQNWRQGNIGVIQIDRGGRLWGVALRCEISWEILRQNVNPPCLSLIWDNDLGEFGLFCSFRGDGHFVLSEDNSA